MPGAAWRRYGVVQWVGRVVFGRGGIGPEYEDEMRASLESCHRARERSGGDGMESGIAGHGWAGWLRWGHGFHQGDA